MLNNPLKYTDPTGNEKVGGPSAQPKGNDHSDFYNQFSNYMEYVKGAQQEKNDDLNLLFEQSITAGGTSDYAIAGVDLSNYQNSSQAFVQNYFMFDYTFGLLTAEEMRAAQSKGGPSIIYQRTTETDQSTIGSFYIVGTKISGYILEPAGPSTTKSELDRRIPAGTYNIIKNVGSKYGLRLYNDQVPQSRAILIHIGNYPGDTEGCLLPGSSIGINSVGDSGSMIKLIMNHFNQVGYKGATITIFDIKKP